MKYPIEIGLDEAWALMEYNQKMADSIPKSLYPDMTEAGHTFEQTAKKFLNRVRELDYFVGQHWPK